MRSTREKIASDDQTRASEPSRVRADGNGASQRTRCAAARRDKTRNAAAKETEEAQVGASASDMKTNTISRGQVRNFQQRRQSKRVRPTSSLPAMPYGRAPSNWSTLALLLAALLSSLLLATCFPFALAGGNLKEPVPTGASHSPGVGSVRPLLSRFERSARIQRAARARPAAGTKPVGGASLRSAGGEPADSMGQQQQQQQLQTSSAARSIKNVTAQNGQSVLLHCLVEADSQGELPQVSWFRGSSEPQLLTYDTTTIIPDERFLVRQGIARPNDWALQIKALDKAQDSGLYQCQTSGDPPHMQSYQLNIVEPQVDILGAPDLAVRLGSAINLTCVISPSADELQFVFWYRDERMINYDFPDETRAKIVMSKWSGGSGQQQRDSITSNLQIFRSQLADAGNYTCAPSGARSSSIQVHVLQASDKRLMLFQQDQESNPLAAGSHHTTSSAISAHVIRLSRGRTYALLVGLFIFATWFQLVAQLQTLVSLFLLAIIGLLLGQRQSQKERRHGEPAEEKLALDAKQVDHDERPLKSSGGAFDLGPGEQVDTRRATAGDDYEDEEGRAELPDEDGRDQLLRGAEKAISLLRTLSFEPDRSTRDEQSCSSVEFDDDAFRSLSFGALDRRMKTPDRTHTSKPIKKLEAERPVLVGSPDESLDGKETGDSLAAPKSAGSQASPSSSSSSAASTGYNSDSTRPCSSSMGGACQRAASTSFQSARRTPNVSLLDGGERDDWRRLDELELLPEPEVIELIKGRPTALRLIIEHLQKSGELSPSGTNSMGRSFAHRPRDTQHGLAHSSSREADGCLPLDLSRAELGTRSASATFQRPD